MINTICNSNARNLCSNVTAKTGNAYISRTTKIHRHTNAKAGVFDHSELHERIFWRLRPR